MANFQNSYLESLLELWDFDNTSTNTRALALFAGIDLTKRQGSDEEERESNNITQSPTPVRTHKYTVDAALPSENQSTVYENYSSVPTINDEGVDSEMQCSIWPVCETTANSVIKCAGCNSKNDANANWCTECGTALIRGRVELNHTDPPYKAEPRICLDLASETCTCNEVPRLFNSKQHNSALSHIPEDTRPGLGDELTLGTVSDVFHHEQCLSDSLSTSSFGGESSIQRECIPLATQCTHLLLNSDDNLDGSDDDSCEEKHVNMLSSNTPFKAYSSDISVLKQSSKPSINHARLNSQVRKDTLDNIAYVCESPCARHWETSGHYMWRKPSTLRQTEHSSKFLWGQNFSSSCGSAQLPRPIPLLDLDRVQPVNESDVNSSTRRRILCDKVYYSTTSTANLICLPDELLLYVMSFLDHSDHVRCMYVCSRFYFIASDQFLWKHITIKRKNLNNQHLSSLAMQYPCVESVTLARCTHEGTPLDLHWFFGELSKLKKLRCIMCDFGPCTGDALLLGAALNCPMLCEVEFDWTLVSDKVLTKSIELIPRLEKVSVRQHGDLPVRIFRCLLSQHRQWLKLLDIGRSLAETLFSVTCDLPLPQLESFAATFSKVDQSTVEDVQVVLPTLKHLYISSSSLTVDAAARLSHLPLVTLHLKLFNDSSLDSASCKYISRMTPLRDLGLDCVNDDSLQALCVGNLLLKKLNLSHSAITYRSLSMIGKSSFKQTLQELKLNGCDGINNSGMLINTCPSEESNWPVRRSKSTKVEDDIVSIIRNCPDLRVIEVSGIVCSNSQDLMTHEGLKHSCKVIL